MNMAEIPYTKRKATPEIRAWSGLNRTQGATDGEVADCTGISTALYPAMSTRPGRTQIGEWDKVTDFFETDGHWIVINDNKLYYDGEFKSNIGNVPKQFCQIGTKVVIWPEKLYINLNTGELEELEANVSGKATMIDRQTIVLSQATGTGSSTFEHIYDYYINDAGYIVQHNAKWTTVYDSVSYSNGWIYSGLRNVSIGSNLVGKFFIGSRMGATSYTTPPNGEPGNLEGTVYGKITKSVISGSYPDTGRATYEYELYDADGLKLTSLFEEGDTVEITGSPLLYNNQEAVRIENVKDTQISIPTMLPKKAVFYNVTADLEIKEYGLISEVSTTAQNYYVYTFTPERTIHAGEQLFVVTDRWILNTEQTMGSAPTVTYDETWQTDAIYCYDPETKALAQFSAGRGWKDLSTSSATTLDAHENIYDAETGMGTITIARKMPELDYICERDNRLWGVSNQEESRIFNTLTGAYETVNSRVLHASALGNPKRWESFDGTAADSYAVGIAGRGDFTGLCSYGGAVIAFKENMLYKLTGDYPAEFYLRAYEVDGIGQGCHRSIAIIGETLYYASRYGIMSYTGSVPALVSYNLDIRAYQDASAGRDSTSYYVSMNDEQNGAYTIYCYDTIREMWSIVAKEQATALEMVDGVCCATIGGKIWKLDAGTGTQEVAWQATLPQTDEGSFETKRYQTIHFVADIKGEMTVEARTDDAGEWQTVGVLATPGKRMHTIHMDTIRCERIQFRLSGTGKTTIWAMQRKFILGSDRV